MESIIKYIVGVIIRLIRVISIVVLFPILLVLYGFEGIFRFAICPIVGGLTYILIDEWSDTLCDIDDFWVGKTFGRLFYVLFTLGE